jgi:hypothetical protein
MESILEIDPLTEFYSAIMNKVTKDRYEKRLGLFFNYLKLQGSLREQAKIFANQAKKDYSWATYQINEYMRHQRARAESKEISESTLPNYYKPIKLFCEENDIVLNWKKISRRIPKGRKHANDRAPTVEEILAILSYHDPRIKPIVLTMVSSGIRVGAWDYLRVKHLEPIFSNTRTPLPDGHFGIANQRGGDLIVGKIKVYAGENEEYSTFVTAEACKALIAWLDSRREAGENVTNESWVMRDLWDDSKYQNMPIARRGFITAPRKLTSTGIRRLIERALVAQGVRKDKLKVGERRYEFQTDHGFRKFYDTVCDQHMKTLFVEILSGRGTGIKESYNRAQGQELLSEYLKAAPYLTLLETIPATSSKDIESLKKENAELRERMSQMEKKHFEREKADSETNELMDELFDDPSFRLLLKKKLAQRAEKSRLQSK